MRQITNREVKTDPVVDANLSIKHALAGLYSKLRVAPLSQLTQHEANCPTLFNEQRLEIVSRSACVSSPSTTIIINTITRNKTKWLDWKKCVIRGGEGALEAHNTLWEEWKGECIDIKIRNRETIQRENKVKKKKKKKKVWRFFEGQKRSVTHNQFGKILQSLFVMG